MQQKLCFFAGLPQNLRGEILTAFLQLLPHGTVTKHYYRYLKGEQTSTNPMATIFAWTGALKKRGQLDKLPALEAFADRLEQASLDTIRSGIMTGDLAGLVEGERPAPVTSEAFLKAIRARMEA